MKSPEKTNLIIPSSNSPVLSRSIAVISGEIAVGKESTLEQPTISDELEESRETKVLDPTRYGDWERNGRCIDF